MVVYRAPFGRALRAVRDDDLAATALGKYPFRIRVIAVGISAGFASVAGVLYGGYLAYIDADSFEPDVSVILIAMVVLGGATTVIGPVVGAFVIVILPEILTLFNIDPAVRGPLEQMIYGLALVVLMLLLPKGIVGKLTRRFRVGGTPEPEPSESMEVARS